MSKLKFYPLCNLLLAIVVCSCGASNTRNEISNSTAIAESLISAPGERDSNLEIQRFGFLRIRHNGDEFPTFRTYGEMVALFGPPTSVTAESNYPYKVYEYPDFSVGLFFPSMEDTIDEKGAVPVITFKTARISVFDGITIGTSKDLLENRLSLFPNVYKPGGGEELYQYAVHFLDKLGTTPMPADYDDQTSRYRYFVTFGSDSETVTKIQVQFGYPDWLR